MISLELPPKQYSIIVAKAFFNNLEQIVSLLYLCICTKVNLQWQCGGVNLFSVLKAVPPFVFGKSYYIVTIPYTFQRSRQLTYITIV